MSGVRLAERHGGVYWNVKIRKEERRDRRRERRKGETEGGTEPAAGECMQVGLSAICKYGTIG